MNDSTVSTLMPPVARIGVNGLPNLVDSMVSGGVYVLIAETPSARFPLLAASLASAIADELVCTVVVPAEPELFIQRIGSYGDLNVPELLAANRLHFFVMQDEFSKKMFRVGAEGFVDELDHFEIPENSYLLFNQADDLLSLHDLSQALDQVDVLRKWAARKQVTILLVFSRTNEAQAGTLNALMDNLSGIVRLGADKNGLALTFDYWQSHEGTIACRNYRLAPLDSGLYEASTSRVSTFEQATDEAPRAREDDVEDTEVHFFYMNPDLGSLAKQMSGTWHQVDTLVGMMHATRNTRSAISILSFQRDTNLRQLAEAVHTLRLSLGRRARIVVQENGASLRYQNEALLLRLGLNLVVNRDVPISRLPLLLDSLSGQIFDRDVGINFEAALASVLPTRLFGYLAPLRFVREVNSILEQAQTLNIPCALMIGKPSAGMTITEALTLCSLSRPGDLVTTDDEYCYLFLNACPQSVMLTTLERLLGRPVDTVFDNIRFLIQREEILIELPVLVRAAEQGALPDYALLLPSSSSLPEEIGLSASTESVRPVPALPAMPGSSSLPIPIISKEQASNTKPASPVKPKLAPAPSPVPVVKPFLHQMPVQPDAPVRAPETVSDTVLFRYDNNAAKESFGRKSVPRATRSAPSHNSSTVLGDDDAKRAQ